MAVESGIRLWRAANDYMELNYASARLHYQQTGERIRDRRGLLHRIAPGTERFPAGLRISVLAEELTVMNNAGASQRMCLLDWLEQWYRVNAELMVYLLGASLGNNGDQITRKLACKVVLEDVPEDYFGTMTSAGAGPEHLEFSAFVIEDGTFSDFQSLGSYLPRSRP